MRQNFPKDSQRVGRRKDYVNKISTVGQPIRELHTLVYLLLLTVINLRLAVDQHNNPATTSSTLLPYKNMSVLIMVRKTVERLAPQSMAYS